MNRRSFVRLAALAPLSTHMRRVTGQGAQAQAAYVGTEHSIHVFRVIGLTWQHVQEVRCEAPSALALHPELPVLYAANDTDTFEGLPSGSVTVFRVGAEGRLSCVQQKRLSLAATSPRSIAIAPDGSHALVAASGGGCYNLLSLQADGLYGPHLGVVKEIGCGPIAEQQQSSHPQHVCFDAHGHVLGADLGTDRVQVLSVQGRSLRLLRRYQVGASAGPSEVLLHPKGSFVAIANKLNDTIQIHRYDSSDGVIGEQIDAVHGRYVRTEAQVPRLVAQDADQLNVYRWSAADGRLTFVQSVRLDAEIVAAQLRRDCLLVCTRQELIRMRLQDSSVQRLETLPNVRSILWPGHVLRC